MTITNIRWFMVDVLYIGSYFHQLHHLFRSLSSTAAAILMFIICIFLVFFCKNNEGYSNP